jgi:crotonobetainyl-CoA:carnitine CoA-transferase CaiB-like acyl-CoA transferase
MAVLPLEGLRIVDLSMWFAGPMASRLLADMGAEVVKIESLRHIDPWRGPAVITPEMAARLPEGTVTERPYNRSAGFNLQNRNKLGITLDLSMAEGKEVFKKLVRISDVVLENYSPRVMSSLGLGYPVLKGIKPDIIMMSLPALGRTGPDKDWVAFGQTIDCLSGMAYLTGYPGEEPMLQSGLSYGDPLSGMNAAFAILAALHYRRRTGCGLHVDLSQVEGLIAFNADSILDYTMNGRVRERQGNRHPWAAPHGCYRCRGEDSWAVIAIESDADWQKFCQAIGQPPWAEDERFSDVVGRWHHQDELDRLVEAWTVQHDHYEVMRILQGAGVAAGPVLDARELIEEPHLNARGAFEEVTHPEVGRHPYVGMYAKFSRTPGHIRSPAPRLGEHNRLVLGDMLGLSSEEIARLEELGVVGTEPAEEQQGNLFTQRGDKGGV